MITINELFDISPAGAVELSTACVALPPFGLIYDSHTDKELAMNEIRYIILKHHYKSPYRAFTDILIRAARIKKDLFGDEQYKLSDIACECEVAYVKEFNSSPVLKMFEAALNGVDYLTTKLLSLQEGVDDVSDVVKWLERLGKIAVSVQELTELVKKEESDKQVKGGSAIGIFELPDNKIENYE